MPVTLAFKKKEIIFVAIGWTMLLLEGFK